MEVIDVPISDIKINFRLRSPSEEKVEELAESISQCGILNPITIDSNNTLIAGYHRVLSFQKLGKETIPAIVKEADKRMNELQQCDENLKRNNLGHLEAGDHIVRREQLLKELGMTYEQGDNRFTSNSEKYTIEDMSKSIGLPKRSYQRRKQISIGLNPEVKDLLTDTPFEESLHDLVKLSSETDEMQMMICNLLISGKCKTWKSAFIEAKYSEFKLRVSPRLDFDVKERWGDFPQSIMRFEKVNDDLRKVCNLINHHEDLRTQKGSLNFGETQIKLHQMNPDQAMFALDYYTQPNDLILDPMNGRGTTALTALHLGRRFIGFEINPTSSKRTREVIKKHMDVPKDSWQLIDGCGCEMNELKDQSETIDAVFTSPPYYGCPEPYANYKNDPRDLCNMDIDDFDQRIDLMFSNLSRLIKRSNYKKKIFHPIIFTVGTYRDADKGIMDMDSSFQAIAKKHSLKLWDKIHLQVNNPHLVCSIQRNYELKFVHKNYETQLVWVKF